MRVNYGLVNRLREDDTHETHQSDANGIALNNTLLGNQCGSKRRKDRCRGDPESLSTLEICR